MLFMSNQHIKKSVSSTVCCYKLVSNLTLATEIIWLCKKCVSQSLSCCVDSESSKCSECMLHTSHKCNLVVSEAEWA